jgi:hypothetical protein
VTYRPELVTIHAVAEVDGVLSTKAACGRLRSGGLDDVQGDFGPPYVMNGGSQCRAVLGIEVFES